MTTSDERREVARKLRETGPSADKHIFFDYDYAGQRIDEIIGTVEVDSWKVFFDRLADLIEPQERTCRCEQDYECDEPVQGRWWTCNACESRFAYERGFRPRYCPECGAKVVEE